MRLIGTILCGLVATFVATACPATIYTYKAADKASNDPDATINDTLTTKNVWAVYVGDSDVPATNSDGDFFPGDSGTNGSAGLSGAGAGGSAWGFHVTDAVNHVYARASITDLIGSPLTHPGDSVAIDFDNGLVGNGGFVGITFYNSGSLSDSTKAALYLAGGDANYTLLDADQSGTATHAFTTDGLNVKLTLGDTPGEYQLDVGDFNIGNRMLVDGISNIGAIQVELIGGTVAMNDNPDFYNLYFNNLTINTVPEVSSAVMIPSALATLGLFGWASGRMRSRAARRSPSPEVS